MFWMRAYQLRGQAWGGWALEFQSDLGPVKWHRADRQVPFGAQKTRVKGVVEQVHKGTLSPCSSRSPPLQNLLEIKRQLKGT